MKTNTCSDYIKLILKRGGRWRNKQIEHAILRDYGIPFQNNTIAKYLSFLIKEGKVLSAPVAEKEKVCFEYWWIVPRKKKDSTVPMTVADLMTKCMEAAKTYPFGHPQISRINEQITRLQEI